MVTVAASLVAASVFVLTSQRGQSVLPVAWRLPDRCYQYCQFASAGGVLYTLARQNEPSGEIANLATYFSLQAYNWSSGSVLWSVSNFTVWGLWWNPPALFVSGGTLAVVASADGEWIPGQSEPPVWSGPQASTFLLEWNASTGAFLNETHYGSYGITGFWAATESQGWIAVAAAPAGSSAAVVQSIPMVVHSGSYVSWNTTIDPGTLPSSYCGSGLRLFEVGGTVSLWVTGGQGIVTLLAGASGTQLWQGPVPGWSSMMTATGGCQPVDLAVGLSALYYVGEVAAGAAIELFNPTTHTTSVVTNLSNTNATSGGLSLLPVGELVVTDIRHNTYSAYSPSGAHLWTRGLNITVGIYTGNGYAASVWGTVVRPVELGTGSMLLSMVIEGGSVSCSGLSCTGALGYSLPLEIVNDTTGQTLWQGSYDSAECFGGCSGAPPVYTPLIGSGTEPYLVFTVYSGSSGSCLVARFAGVT